MTPPFQRLQSVPALRQHAGIPPERSLPGVDVNNQLLTRSQPFADWLERLSVEVRRGDPDPCNEAPTAIRPDQQAAHRWIPTDQTE
jgi:hypothetical protein